MSIFDRFSLAGRVALVTGGGRGLGFEIARAFAEAGSHVVVTGRTAAVLDGAVAAIATSGGSAQAAAFDIADVAAGRTVIADIRRTRGRLDILVNNVGARDRRPLAAFGDDDILDLIRTDLLSAISLARDAAEIMKAQGHGRLIAVTSIVGEIARPGDAVYPAAKQGLTGLMRSIAVEYGAHGVTSNAIAPGMFATETNAALAED
ncbi:SDR family NAD(P)-dependent oxidoreductase, partial [Mesorhizobium sp. M6A.T.Ca.TU.002.02.2.1]